MSIDTDRKRTVKSVESLFEIVESLKRLDGGGVTELADDTGLAKSTVHKHLTTLEDNEFVVSEGGTYRLSLQSLEYGMHARNRLPVVELALPSLKQMAADTGEVVWLVIEEHGRAVYVSKKTGGHSIDPVGSVGKRDHLHYLAAGKAILSTLPDARVREIIDRHGLPEQTDRTITDPAELFAELEEIRERNGVAFNDNEEVEGLRAVGAPIVHEGTRGAISVSGPANRMRDDRFRSEMPSLVLGATNEIELKLMD